MSNEVCGLMESMKLFKGNFYFCVEIPEKDEILILTEETVPSKN